MLILSYTPVVRTLSVNYTSIYENFELNFFKNTKFVGEIFGNCLNVLLRTNFWLLLQDYSELILLH